VLLPFLGANSFRGDLGGSMDAGFRIGLLMGPQVSRYVSINGELVVDFLNFRGVPTGTDVTAADIDLGLSPLAHIPATERLEVVAGPSFGFWFRGMTASGSSMDATKTAVGWVAGANLGAFAHLSRKSALGVLLSYSVRSPLSVCETGSSAPDNCDVATNFRYGVLGTTIAGLF
jgi:hypothetical protein